MKLRCPLGPDGLGEGPSMRSEPTSLSLKGMSSEAVGDLFVVHLSVE